MKIKRTLLCIPWMLVVAGACGAPAEFPTLVRPPAAAPSTEVATAPSPVNDAATAKPPAEPSPEPQPEPTPPPPPPEPCPEGMVMVEGGTYQQGPFKREVTVQDLCVDRTEVTAAAYQACVEAKACTDNHLDCADAKTLGIEGKENHPVVCVDHPQAVAYCEHAGKRLPTLGEWEWFARGRSEGHRYAWGQDPAGDQACWSGSSTGARDGTCEVGSFPDGTTPQGLLDVSGNVFEWTSSPADASGKMMVGKGGSWRDGVTNLLAVARPMGFEPQYRCGFGGMRCVTEPTAP